MGKKRGDKDGAASGVNVEPAASAAATDDVSDDEGPTEPETVPTLTEARAAIKRKVLAAYPEIVASLKDVKACASDTSHRRNGRRLLSSA